MSTTTQNIGLTKPSKDEIVNVDVFNGNFDIIDEKINETNENQMQIATASYDWTVGALSAGASGYIKLAVSDSITVLNLVNVLFNTGNISGCAGLQLTPIFVGNGEFYFQYYAPKAIATGVTVRVYIKYQT